MLQFCLVRPCCWQTDNIITLRNTDVAYINKQKTNMGPIVRLYTENAFTSMYDW